MLHKQVSITLAGKATRLTFTFYRRQEHWLSDVHRHRRTLAAHGAPEEIVGCANNTYWHYRDIDLL
jgi:hypothetical protein